MVAATATLPPLTKADKAHGYRLGCEGYLTADEAAKHSGVSTRTVRRWCDEKWVRFYKLDPKEPKSAVRICRHSLDKFLASREQ